MRGRRGQIARGHETDQLGDSEWLDRLAQLSGNDPLARSPVAEGVRGARHLPVLLLVVQEPGDLAHDALQVGPDVQLGDRAHDAPLISSGKGCHRSRVRRPAFHVRHSRARVEGGQGRGRRRGGVALHQQPVGLLRAQHRLGSTGSSRCSTAAATCVGVWLLSITCRSWSGVMPKSASTWSSIWRCCAVTQTRASRRSGCFRTSWMTGPS